MFILSNCTKGNSFKIDKINNKTKLEAKEDNITYAGIERNSPVNFLCFKHLSNVKIDKIQNSQLKSAKFINIEIFCEKDSECTREGTIETLVTSFGNEKSKENFRKRELNTQIRLQTIKFNVENKLLPEFNHDATSVSDLYCLDLMFNSETLANFLSLEIEQEELCSIVKKVPYTEENKSKLIAIDCLYKFLTVHLLNDSTISPQYKFFFDEIKSDCIRGRMSGLLKDRLIVKFYILLLIVNGYKMSYEAMPKFGLPRTKVYAILRAIGCGISSAGVVTLSNMPQETFSQ